MTLKNRQRTQVLGVPIDVLSWEDALATIADWARRRESRFVCLCNAHSVVTARQDDGFGRVIAGADLATPDGTPVAWMLRRFGHAGQQRINGPDLMWRYCREAAQRGESICLYGGTPQTLALLEQRLCNEFPGLVIAGAWSPPFRPLTAEEDDAAAALINACGAGTVWVGLGCPKQEFWMAASRGRVKAVMIGVGAAFDFHAGAIGRAPGWMQRGGLEWLHRLISDPRRLWKRYLVTNTLFVLGAARQLLLGKFSSGEVKQ